MIAYFFITFVPAIINLGLSTYVWSRNSGARENRLLALACFGLSIYCFRTFEVNTRSVDLAQIIFPLLTFGPLLAGVALSDFLMTIADRPLFSRRWMVVLCIYFPVLFFSLGEVFTDWFYTGLVVGDDGGFMPIGGPYSGLPNCFLLGLLLLALIKSVVSVFSVTEYNRRKQLIWSVTGIGISVFTMIGLLYLPDSIVPYNNARAFLTGFVAFSTNLIAGTMAYAIARYGLAPSMEELRRREAEARAHAAELQGQLIDAQMREERRRQELLEKELETARRMQMALMPEKAPEIEGFSIAGRCVPATEVGGDYFQYFQKDGKFLFCVADVTGHAMEAAIPVVLFGGILESEVQHGTEPQSLFTRLNHTLKRTLDDRTFVCFSLGELELSTRLLRLCNAACPFPYHYHASTGSVDEIRVEAYPLGIRSDTVHDVFEATLQQGDCIVFLSDGIPEAGNLDGEPFGYDRTNEVIRRACQSKSSAEGIIDQILEAVDIFKDVADQVDDMTCVVLRVEI